MRKARSELCRHFPPPRLLQGGARLAFFGDVHRQDVNPATGVIRGQRDPDAP